MGDLMSLPDAVKGFILRWLTVISFVMFLEFLRYYRTERKRIRLLISAAEAVFSYVFDFILISQVSGHSSLLSGISAASVMILVLALTAIAGAELFSILRQHRTTTG